MRRFYVSLAWGSLAFVSLALDVVRWLVYHQELKDIVINSAIGVLCVISFVFFIKNAKKDINGQ